MATENLEKKCRKELSRIDRNVEEIKHILNHMVATNKYYLTGNGHDEHTDYY